MKLIPSFYKENFVVKYDLMFASNVSLCLSIQLESVRIKISESND